MYFIIKSEKNRKISEICYLIIFYCVCTSLDYDGMVLLFSYGHSHVACFDIAKVILITSLQVANVTF
jgi:hypothetical protein